MSNWKILFCTLTFAFDFIPFFITQLFHKFDNHSIHSLSLFWIMPPKSDRNKSNPEKHAELNENWANNLTLKIWWSCLYWKEWNSFFCSTIISKLCNVMMCLEQVQRLQQKERSKVTCNCMNNPGLIPTTGLFRECNPIFTTVFAFLTKNVFKVAVSGTILIVKSRLVKLSCVHALRMMLIKYLNFMSIDLTVTLQRRKEEIVWLIKSPATSCWEWAPLVWDSGIARRNCWKSAARVSNEVRAVALSDITYC